MSNIIFPNNLKKGDKIAIISPAGSVDESQILKGLKLIELQGYEPVLAKHALGKFSNGYNYSGTEKERISDLNWAFNNDDIAAIWATRGGYGCQHLLRHLKLSKFRKNPKWYIGYSDNTVVQSYLLKNGFASIHGQTLKTSSFGVTEEGYKGIFDIMQGKRPKYEVASNEFNKIGNVEGEIVGGNLALIYALLGSNYSFNFKDKILFIEDIGENFYALDRMLISLDLAGVFSKIKGLIVGGMINMGSESDNKQYEESFDSFAYNIISQRVSKYNFPVAFGFPNGHIYDNRPLIIGGQIQLSIDTKSKVTFK